MKLTKAQEKALADIAIAEHRRLKRGYKRTIISGAHTRTLTKLEEYGLILQSSRWYKNVALTKAGRKAATWLLIDRARIEMESEFRRKRYVER